MLLITPLSCDQLINTSDYISRQKQWGIFNETTLNKVSLWSSIVVWEHFIKSN